MIKIQVLGSRNPLRDITLYSSTISQTNKRLIYIMVNIHIVNVWMLYRNRSNIFANELKHWKDTNLLHVVFNSLNIQ